MRSRVGRYAYRDRSGDAVAAVDELMTVLGERMPQILLFSLFCLVWAAVFTLVLR